MTIEEHARFVSEIIQEKDFNLPLPNPEDEDYLGLIIHVLNSRRGDTYLLGSALTAWLMAACAQKSDPQKMMQLASLFEKSIVSKKSKGVDDFVEIGLIIRSYLFWFYINTGCEKRELLYISSRLHIVCVRSRPKTIAKAELMLSTGGHIPDWRPQSTR